MAETARMDTRQRRLVSWIIGLTLLALLLAGITLALRTPAPVGTDDGTSPAGHIQEEQNQTPRTLRQYAATPRGTAVPAVLSA